MDKLIDEQFDINVITFQNNEIHKYVLLHCKIDRLFEEAERVKLEMRLNNVHLALLLAHLIDSNRYILDILAAF